MSQANFCEYCGAKNRPDNRFCESCGQALVDSSDPTPQTSSQYAPYQSSRTNVSTSGSYDALPSQQSPYLPQKKPGLPGIVKALILIFFIGIPGFFFLIFFVLRDLIFP
jgi:hypothetical protein